MKKIALVVLTVTFGANGLFAQMTKQQPTTAPVQNAQPTVAPTTPETATAPKNFTSTTTDKTKAQPGQERLTQEDEFRSKLNPQMQVVFDGLTPEGKAMAIMLSAQTGEDVNAAVKRAVQKIAHKKLTAPAN